MKYTIVDSMDEQERMGLRPKYSKAPVASWASAMPHQGVCQGVKMGSGEKQLGQRSS